jgi:hypothetical protein
MNGIVQKDYLQTQMEALLYEMMEILSVKVSSEQETIVYMHIL